MPAAPAQNHSSHRPGSPGQWLMPAAAPATTLLGFGLLIDQQGPSGLWAVQLLVVLLALAGSAPPVAKTWGKPTVTLRAKTP